MKKTLLTLALAVVSVAAFAQGKVSMVNDGTRLVYFTSTAAGDGALQNQAATATLPSGRSLIIDLYGGATAGSMVLQSSTTLSAAIPGGFGPINFVSPNMAGGVVGFWQIQVREAAFATEALSGAAGGYAGHSAIFQGRAGSSLAFFAINNALANNFQSTWAAGSVDLGGGNFGAIPIGIVPEPSSMALAGLGAASLLLFRRRK